MVTGQHGTPGQPAHSHVEVGLRHGAGHVTIQHLSMGATVWGTPMKHRAVKQVPVHVGNSTVNDIKSGVLLLTLNRESTFFAVLIKLAICWPH